MIDGVEANDKIIAILKGDQVCEKWEEISDCPSAIMGRLKHDFLTHEMRTGEKTSGNHTCVWQ